MKGFRFWLVISGLLMSVFPAVAAADKFAGAFLEGGAGARALGMGNAYTAIADDASAVYWNPAGLAGIRNNEVLIAHEFRFGELVDFSYGAGVVQVKQRDGRLGFGIIRLGVDDIAFPDSSLWDDIDRDGDIDPGEFRYDALRDADKIRLVNDAEYGFFLTYAQPKGPYQIGGSLKVIRQSVGEFSSFGLGVDVGILRHGLWRNLDVGLAVHDLTGTYLSWSTGRKETISPVPRLGLAYRIQSDALRGSLLFASDVEMHFDDRGIADQLWTGPVSANLNWGLEFTMQNRLALRLGLRESTFQAGAGFTAGRMQFDYGIVPDPVSRADFDVSQRLSVRYVHLR